MHKKHELVFIKADAHFRSSSLLFLSSTGLVSGGGAHVSICKELFKGVSTSIHGNTVEMEMRLVHVCLVPQ